MHNIDFKYVDSHDKTCAVRDSSLRTTLEARIRERLSNSKNMAVILSFDTRKTGSMLSYEIEKAIDHYKIPLIITYVDYQVVAKPAKLSKYWPEALRLRIENGTAKAIHIPFAKDTVLKSIEQFNVDNMPATAMDTYCKADYRTFGSSG